MIYAIIGENSSAAIRKLREIKAAFLKKHLDASLHEMEGVDVDASSLSLLGEQSIFSQKRLVILKRFYDADTTVQRTVIEHMPLLKSSPDIFVFWEHGIDSKNEFLFAIQNHAAKIQMVPTVPDRVQPGASVEVFRAIDRIFEKPALRVAISADALRSVTALDFLSPLLWKLKTIFLVIHGNEQSLKPFVAAKARAAARMFDADAIRNLFWKGILTDAAIKKDAKYTHEHFERFIFSLEARKGVI